MLQIHDREAHADVLRVLAEEGAPERTVFHCFSGDAAMARFCADRGWYLSFAGTVTFGNAASLREALRAVPLDRVLVETDAPYLAPAPYRGRPNAGYLVPLTLRRMAEELGRDLECPVPAHRRDQRGRLRPLVTPVLAECGDARRMRKSRARMSASASICSRRVPRWSARRGSRAVMSVSNVFSPVVGEVTYLIVTCAYTGHVIIGMRIRRVAGWPERDH